MYFLLYHSTVNQQHGTFKMALHRRHNSSVHISSSIDYLTFQLPDLSSHYKFESNSIHESQGDTFGK